MFTLLTAANPKAQKSREFGYFTAVLHLAPADRSGYETCASRSQGCTKACLNLSGRGGMFKAGESSNRVQAARLRKTVSYFEDRANFLLELKKGIALAQWYAAREDLQLAIRLNATSDIRWERHDIIQSFPGVQFYDYTKIANRRVDGLDNYHLTFSATESNHRQVKQVPSRGMNVAVVFDQVPDVYLDHPVVNGDQHDLRFLDPKGVIVGLTAKGPARRDTTGFVRRVIDIQPQQA